MFDRKPKYVPDSAYVQVRKVLPYSVTPINDLEIWRKERKALTEALDTKHAARVQNVKEALQSGTVDVEAAKALQAVLDAEKAQYVAMQKSYKNATEAPQQPGYNPTGVWVDVPPSPTFAERLKAAAQSLWKSAFPE